MDLFEAYISPTKGNTQLLGISFVCFAPRKPRMEKWRRERQRRGRGVPRYVCVCPRRVFSGLDKYWWNLIYPVFGTKGTRDKSYHSSPSQTWGYSVIISGLLTVLKRGIRRVSRI